MDEDANFLESLNHSSKETLSRRKMLMRLGIAALVGPAAVGISVNALIGAFNKTEINRDTLPDAVSKHFTTEMLMAEGLLILPPSPTTTPDIWRAASVSLWSEDHVIGGSLVELSPTKYGLMTTSSALQEVTTRTQVYAFLPGLEMEDVTAAADNNSLNPFFNRDTVAFRSKAFQKIAPEKFRKVGNGSVVVLPFSEEMGNSIQRAKSLGFIQPLQVSSDALQVGDFVGGARFDLGINTKYTVISEEQGSVTVNNDTQNGHFIAKRLGDGVVFLQNDDQATLTPKLVGFTGKTLATQDAINGRGSVVATLASKLTVIKMPSLK